MFDWATEKIHFKTVRLDKNKSDLEVFKPVVDASTLLRRPSWGTGAGLSQEETRSWFEAIAQDSSVLPASAVLEAIEQMDASCKLSPEDEAVVRKVLTEVDDFKTIGFTTGHVRFAQLVAQSSV
eukprot:TRINITY_DN15482_c0_g11_i2.p1 TRINITY_DN15482_c0_g11~~TRINITY_DN15482_c0_g11_i2.p1  ORF type:complete len:124 (-),score=37.67 TRINITY_DN15482_c0_g11_i2:173-544(-)